MLKWDLKEVVDYDAKSHKEHIRKSTYLILRDWNRSFMLRLASCILQRAHRLTHSPDIPLNPFLSGTGSESGPEGGGGGGGMRKGGGGGVQLYVVSTCTEDRLLPMLLKSGETNLSVRLLHTTRADGSTIRKLWISGMTTLERQRSKVNTEDSETQEH